MYVFHLCHLSCLPSSVSALPVINICDVSNKRQRRMRRRTVAAAVAVTVHSTSRYYSRNAVSVSLRVCLDLSNPK
ncbi:hypothetical protein LX36DRAFT_422936 [Colletotrichum falcatum]|nr:hypothetical protein LX36DRAFT_422936 [Colletotrichum falcatum]